MADTVVRTFSLLIDTDQKLDQLTKETFRRNKGDVVDLAVSELWTKLHSVDEENEILSRVPDPGA